MEEIIKVKNLSKIFTIEKGQQGFLATVKSFIKPKKVDFEAVKNLSFNIKKGEIFGLIGANGAGKSTTIKMLTGILTPTSGSVEVAGLIPSKDRRKYVKKIGVVFGQRTQLWWDLPLNDTYNVLKKIYQIPSDVYQKEMNLLNDILELDDFINQPVRTLSLGQRMRADIAASLLHNPEILFLDEPTIGLDVAVKDKIRTAIKTINKEKKTTVILTTHDLQDIESLCNRIYLIDRGENIFDGSIEELKQKYGKKHEIIFEMESITDAQRVDYSGIFSLIEKKVEDNFVQVYFDSTKVSAPDIIRYTLKLGRIRNFSVKDTELEEIIKKFIRKELTKDG